MKRALLVFTAVVSVVGLTVGISPAGAKAGGWAVATFDPLPPLVAGDTVEVGFTIRQHGVTPVDPGTGMWSEDADELQADKIGVTVTDSSGHSTFVPAEPSGRSEGHFVAPVQVPDDTSIDSMALRAEMGWFGPSPDFQLPIAAADGSESGGWFGELPTWMGVVLPAVGATCLLFVVVDLVTGRMRRRSDRAALATTGAAASDVDVWIVDPASGPE